MSVHLSVFESLSLSMDVFESLGLSISLFGASVCLSACVRESGGVLLSVHVSVCV